jgi:hypothetical protein
MKTRLLVFATGLAAATIAGGCRDAATSESPSPILVLADRHHFGPYIGELLSTEGFHEFTTDSLGSTTVSPSYLKRFDIVLLGQTPVTDQQQSMLTTYVEGGGTLIAFRPDKKMSALFGIAKMDGVISEAYLSVDSANRIGKGITVETMQFHGEGDRYELADGLPVASFCSDEHTATDFPAVVIHASGEGQAIAFLYNLPESIVLTRQGNYRHAGQEKDGILGLRAMDLFTGGWVNRSKNTLNQADEQMRLLTHCIEGAETRKKPLPRFWYFPDTLKCIVTLNNDGEDSKEAEFIKQFQDVKAKGARMTLYIKEVEYVSKGWVDQWTKNGFEIGGHPDDTRQAAQPDWKTMDSVFASLNDELKATYGLPAMKTVTNHWFVWVGSDKDGNQDFSAQAKIEEKHGVGLDCNYAHYDNGSTFGHFLGASGTLQGNYTGSGLPMRFADMHGNIMNVYQQLNNVYDQQYMEHKDQDGYFNAFRGIMDRSLNDEVYSTVSVKAHNNEYFFSEIPLMKMLDYAKTKNVPVWTVAELLGFLRAKAEARFDNIRWSDNTLSFRLRSSVTNENGITFLLPAEHDGRRVTNITANGRVKTLVVKPVKRSEYAWVTVAPGTDYDIEAIYR